MAFLDSSGVTRLWEHIVYKLGNKVDKESLSNGHTLFCHTANCSLDWCNLAQAGLMGVMTYGFTDRIWRTNV